MAKHLNCENYFSDIILIKKSTKNEIKQNMDIQYEERFGIKVDTRIPAALKAWLCDEFEAWKTGNVEVSRRSLLTRYEHFIYGSGVAPTPDPFKPLALQHEGADLGAVIEARRRVYPPGKEDIGSS